MQTVLLSSNSIMTAPAPSVEIKSLDAQAIEFELSFRVQDFAASAAARHEVYDLIYRHARAAGLQLALPAEGRRRHRRSRCRCRQPQRRGARNCGFWMPCRCSRRSPKRKRRRWPRTMTRKAYRKGEVLVEQGAKLDALDGHPQRRRRREVPPGQGQARSRWVGWRPVTISVRAGLFTGSGETGTVQALTAAVVYEVGQAALATLMHDRPSIADEISVTLSRRTKVGSSEPAHTDEGGPRSVSWLVGRIRELFEVPHA